jgi:hypothetical protein
VAEPNANEFLMASTRGSAKAEGDLIFGGLSGSSNLNSEAPLVPLLSQMNPDKPLHPISLIFLNIMSNLIFLSHLCL